MIDISTGGRLAWALASGLILLFLVGVGLAVVIKRARTWWRARALPRLRRRVLWRPPRPQKTVYRCKRFGCGRLCYEDHKGVRFCKIHGTDVFNLRVYDQ